MNAEYCPRCGQPNRCAQAGQDQPVQDCWCFHTPVEPGTLDQVPTELRGQGCLCSNCLRLLAGKPTPN